MSDAERYPLPTPNTAEKRLASHRKRLTPLCPDCKHNHVPKRMGGKTCEDAEDDRNAFQWHDAIVTRIAREQVAEAQRAADAASVDQSIPVAERMKRRLAQLTDQTTTPERDRAGKDS